MIEYSADKKRAYFDGHTFTRDEKTGYYLSTARVEGRRRRLHVYVWESVHGAVPSGWHIHHIDQDKGNNEPDNLACLPRHNHMSHHSKLNADDNPEEIEMSLALARSAAAVWHKSKAGRDWHKKHYEKTGARMYIRRTYKCEYCGKEFTTTKVGSRFCCNSHKTAFRYHSGVDNEERVCCICGRPFTVNKYQHAVTCGRSCAMKLQWKHRNK